MVQWHSTPVPLPGKSHGRRSLVGCSPWGREESDRLSDFTFTFHVPALEKEMATHSSVLAWRIPRMGEPGGLPSMGSHSRTQLKQLSSSSTVSQTQRHLPSFTHLKERALGLIHPRNTSTHSEKGLMYTDAMSYS